MLCNNERGGDVVDEYAYFTRKNDCIRVYVCVACVSGMLKAVGRISKFLNVCIVKMRVVNRNNYDIVSDAQSMLGR